jgi:hypothetical protein
MGAFILGTHWYCGECRWFEIPDRVCGLRCLEILLPWLLVAALIALPLCAFRIWRIAPRPITAILFLITVAIGLVILVVSPYISLMYRREQPVVGLMLLFSMCTTVEVYLWNPRDEHIITALTTVPIVCAFWVLILALMGAV